MENMELRVCLTQECNFRCVYCRPGGEGIYNNNNLKNEELFCIIEKLAESGVESIRFTGGEPLLRDDLVEIADYVSSIKGISNISLVTNGSLLNAKTVRRIKSSKIKSVTVSLDTLDKNKFLSIAGVDCLDDVINGIKLLVRYEVPVRINTVVSKSNISDITDLIEFCKEYRITLKLLDLVKNNNDSWEDEFIPLSILKNEMIKRSTRTYIRYPNGNLGTPMDVYYIEPIEVLVKDNTIGTCYSEQCTNCSIYPCQSGIVSLILTHDGFLKLCSLSNAFNLDLKPLVSGDIETQDKLVKYVENYKNSTFKNIWYKSLQRAGECV